MKQSGESEIFIIMLEILIDGPNWKKGDLDNTAILLLPGVYQEYRISQGVKIWPKEGKYLWVAGTRGDPSYTREDIIRAVGADSPDIVCQGFAKHTLDQMEWCVSLLKENPKINHLIVTTAAYHLPRCCLTLLQVLKKSRKTIAISPVPILNPAGDSFSPESSENFVAETKKIQEYQEKEDVLSLESWREYINWRIKKI